MIELRRQGHYELAETATHTHLLTLEGGEHFAWILAKGIGEILVTAKRHHVLIRTLARGNFRLYEVQNEIGLSDGIHLELALGGDDWQGYLLPHGLPDGRIRRLVVPTWETISSEPTRLQKLQL